MRVLVVVAVAREADAIASMPDVTVVTAGIGRTNAAAATTESILRDGPYDAVLSTGVAGALPGSDLDIGESVVASSCVYVEEGLIAEDGFHCVDAMGFSLGDFGGNAVPVDPDLREALAPAFRTGCVATVATCSGTDAAARLVAGRTGAVAEAMEGAAVVHAARRLRTPAIELRVISNWTGNRAHQQWDLVKALAALGEEVPRAIARLVSSAP